MATIQANQNSTIAGDYFTYLNSASANQLTASQDSTAAAVAINGQNVGGATFTAGLNQTVQLTSLADQLAAIKDSNASQVAVSAQQYSAATAYAAGTAAVAGVQSNLSAYETSNNAALASYGTQLAATNSAVNQAGQKITNLTNSDYATSKWLNSAFNWGSNPYTGFQSTNWGAA
jgi:hypothetical protein